MTYSLYPRLAVMPRQLKVKVHACPYGHGILVAHGGWKREAFLGLERQHTPSPLSPMCQN